MSFDFTKEEVERIAEKVHESWWKEKKLQGFHSPTECLSKSANEAHQHAIRDYANFDFPKYNKFCDKCHPDMYLYSDLSDNIKEYDRVTVRTVLSAINSLS